jgi:hypothetical protein
VQTRDGRLPAVLYTVPTEFGERVMLWCRAGIVPRDLIAARDILRAACWAADVRVIVNEQRSHVVVLEVIRRLPPEQPPCPHPQPGEPEWPRQDRAEGDGAWGDRGLGDSGLGDSAWRDSAWGDSAWDDDGPEEPVLYGGLGLPRPFG